MSGLRILTYHAISDLSHDDPARRYGVPLAAFQAQVDQLGDAGYAFVDADELLAFLAGRRGPSPPGVLVTFDDCYTSVAAAARWMCQRNIPGVAFAIGGALVPGAPVAGTIQPLLNRDGLRALVDAGVEIGAHSHSHLPLVDVPVARRPEEIAGALARLGAADLGPIRLFAYPYGVYDAAIANEVRLAGAEAAMTVAPGLVRPGDDPFRLRRIEIFRGETGLAFQAKVATGGGMDRLRAHVRLRTRLRRLRRVS